MDPRPNGRELSVDQQPHGSLRQRCPNLHRKFTSCQVPRNTGIFGVDCIASTTGRETLSQSSQGLTGESPPESAGQNPPASADGAATLRARPTMRDVAALARVSLKTVSRVINGETTVDARARRPRAPGGDDARLPAEPDRAEPALERRPHPHDRASARERGQPVLLGAAPRGRGPGAHARGGGVRRQRRRGSAA